ncbi:MAG: tetratricopeptide repeat protein [Flavobacteriaceae bacterium]
MKKYMLVSLSLLFATGMYAQKSEIKAMKKIMDKKAPTEADYRELQGIIDATAPYIGNAKPEEQAEFYYHKGNFELQQALKANNVDALNRAADSFNKLKAAEENAKRQTFTDKFNAEILPVLRAQAFQKALDFNNNKKFREATSAFKAIYDLDKDPMNLYYAASTALSVPDYNTSLEYYQELLDMNFTGEGVYYTALNKNTGERESFGDNKVMLDAAVKSGEYSDPKQEKDPSKKPEILKNMVLIYNQVNQKSRAVSLLEDARKESPNDMDLLLLEAEFRYQNNEMDKFENLMKEAVGKDPNNPNLYFNLGVITAETGNIEKAREYYQKAIRLNPKYVDAHINLGALVLKDEEKIVEKMNAITGFSAADNKKYDELKKQRDDILKSAIPHFEKALSIDPSNEYAIANLVGIYGALEMTDKLNEYKAKQK